MEDGRRDPQIEEGAKVLHALDRLVYTTPNMKVTLPPLKAAELTCCEPATQLIERIGILESAIPVDNVNTLFHRRLALTETGIDGYWKAGHALADFFAMHESKSQFNAVQNGQTSKFIVQQCTALVKNNQVTMDLQRLSDVHVALIQGAKQNPKGAAAAFDFAAKLIIGIATCEELDKVQILEMITKNIKDYTIEE